MGYNNIYYKVVSSFLIFMFQYFLVLSRMVLLWSIEVVREETREIGQWLTILADFPEVLSSIPSTHIGTQYCLKL